MSKKQWWLEGDCAESRTPLGDLKEYPTKEAAASAYGVNPSQVVLASSAEEASR